MPLPKKSTKKAKTPVGSVASFVDDATILTREGLKKLKLELEELKTIRRPEIAKRLKEAISFGDLSENAEYDEAKNEQAFVEGRVLELEQMIKNAQVISEKKGKYEKIVEIGATITVRNKTDRDDPEDYQIVGATEADPLTNKISNESPLGKAVLGHEKGETVEVSAPSGILRYEIIKIA